MKTRLSRHLFGKPPGLFLSAGPVWTAAPGTAAWLKIRNSQFKTMTAVVTATFALK